jgi:hypothetical protein
LRAQSLAAVAASEAARRKAQKAPSKVYTNDTLAAPVQGAPIPDSPTPAGSAVDAKSDAKSGANGANGSGATAKPEAVDEKKTEAYWKSRSSTLQQNLARNKVLTEAMQSRINALHADALSADDPGRQAMLQTNLSTAMSEMERLKKETDSDRKDLDALHEEARRANIPPGWLR